MVFHQARLVLLLAGLATTGCSRTPKTYAANCSTPHAHWGREKDGIGHLRTVQPIYIGADGSTLWNRVAISDATLRRYMAQMSSMNPEPQAVLDVAPAVDCDRVEAVRTIMDAAPLCKGPNSLCSEGGNWKQWPELGGP
jgi:biopolymer transport protein ExbD